MKLNSIDYRAISEKFLKVLITLNTIKVTKLSL